MAKRNGNGKNGGKNGRGKNNGDKDWAPRVATMPEHRLHPDTKKSIWAISFICVAVILILAGFGIAGPAGQALFNGLDALFGWGYFILPATLLFAAAVLLLAAGRRVLATTLIGGGLLILAFLG